MKSKGIQMVVLSMMMVFFLLPSFAEEGEEEEERGTFFIEVEDWFVKPSNFDYEIATLLPSEIFIHQGPNISLLYSYDTSFKYKIGWAFKDNIGSLSFVYWGFGNDEQIVRTDPGNFSFIQNLSFPLYAGAYDEGKADGVRGDFKLRTRSLSFLFSRDFTQMKRIHGSWKIGIRKVILKHRSHIEYLTLLPTLIAPFPPAALAPLNDTVQEESSFEARGFEAGASFYFPIVKKVSFGGDVGISFLRGDSKAEYNSTNHYYVDNEGNYFRIKDRAFQDGDAQRSSTVFASANERESIIQILEADLKVRWNMWRGLDLVVGYSVSLWSGVLMRETLLISETSFFQEPSPDSKLFIDYSQFSRSFRKDIAFEGVYLRLAYQY